MPKKDPITGCEVMTEGEFWAAEAKSEGEGRTGADLREEFMDDMEADRQLMEDELRAPVHALAVLKDAVLEQNHLMDGDNDYVPLPLPVEVYEVLSVRFSQSSRESATFIRARALREDGVEDVIEMTSSDWSGTFYEPPDHEALVIWESLDDFGKTISWAHLFTINNPGYTSPAEAKARAAKADYLYKVLRKAGIRCRIHEDVLQVNEAQANDAYQAIGRHLFNLPIFHSLWNENPR